MTTAVYDLRAYGIVPDTNEDSAAAVQAFFDTLEYGEDETHVHFPKGTYRIFRPIRIRGAKHLTLHGNSSTVVAHFDPCGPISENNDVFCFEDCADLTVCDFFFDTDNPIGAAGTVTAIDYDASTVDMRIDGEFPVTGREHFCGTNSFDEKGSPDYAMATYHNTPTEQQWTAPDGTIGMRLVGLDYDVIGEHMVRMKLGGGKISPKLHTGHRINVRYEIYGNSIFNFSSCRDVTLENIVIYSAASFGATIRPRSENFTFDNFCIRVPDTSTRLKAANADGIHALGLAGKLTLRHCNMEGMGDDTLNIHGTAGGIHALDPENKTVTMICPRRHEVHPLPARWAEPGDTIYVYDSETFLQKGTFRVERVDADTETGAIRAVYREESGTFSVGDTLANAEYFAALHIDSCCVRNTRARGFLVQTHNVLIENSHISGMSLAALLFAPDIRVWWEVGPCRNVEIRNNIIEHCAHIESGANQGAVIFKACHDGNTAGYPAGVHENIHIHGNRFRDIPQSAIYVSSAKGVRIEGNVFEHCCYAPCDRAEYAKYDIVAVNCEDVEIGENVSDRGVETLAYVK
ncbi:MAG: right-handed parallel beta-helix repeat-containing protein [Clostridia bacterium]|nr:right-handed parallel beta-helix repeat-containing protein [Clostridia bacterium]